MDTKDLTKVQKDREEKLKKLRSEGFNFPNDFEKKDQIGDLVQEYNSLPKETDDGLYFNATLGFPF